MHPMTKIEIGDRFRAIVFARLPQDRSKATATQTTARILAVGRQSLAFSRQLIASRNGQLHTLLASFPPIMTLELAADWGLDGAHFCLRRADLS